MFDCQLVLDKGLVAEFDTPLSLFDHPDGIFKVSSMPLESWKPPNITKNKLELLIYRACVTLLPSLEKIF